MSLLRPEPSRRRRLDYSPKAKLWVPPGVREREARADRRTQGMDVTCPKCGILTGSPRGYHIVMCMADEAPYVGENRGCGWMLMAEPPYYKRNRVARVRAVIDCRIDRQTGRGYDPRMPDQLEELVPLEWVDGTGEKRFAWNVRPSPLRQAGYQMIRQDWEERGLVKLVRDADGRVVDVEYIATSAEADDPEPN